MCGIAGQFSFRKNVITESIHKMTESLAHRGPDESGYFIKDHVGLGFRRLSIIDLEGGSQPIFNEDKSLCIIFNGEIYNYSELKKRLKNHQFRTRTDTEVILHLFEDYGTGCFGMLNGMFALAILDINEGTLYCARDRFGQKPFIYYHLPGEHFIFASEIDALFHNSDVSARIDTNILPYYFFYNYIPVPYTIYRDIHKLPAQSFIKIDSQGIKIQKYSIPFETGYDCSFSLDEAVEEVDNILEKAVERHMIADIDVGIFLSGGLDSTAILKYASKFNPEIQSFSATFGKHANESEYFMQAWKKYGGKHQSVDIIPEFSEFEKIISRYSEPLGDSAIIPTYLISRFASNYVKVVLTGEGGDEIFGGYDRYVELSNDPNRLLGWLKHLIRTGTVPAKKSLKERYLSIMADRGIAFMKNSYDLDLTHLNEHLEGIQLNSLEDIIVHEQNQRLPDNLFVKIDIASMANGLEARSPLLDHELFDFMSRLPVDYKVTKKLKKIIMKRILARDFPAEFINRKKCGFGAPVWQWLKNKKYQAEVMDVFQDHRKALSQIMKMDHLTKFLKDFSNNEISYEHWKIFVLVLWLKSKGIRTDLE